jgi:serine phosphatase RsbU (regulator of sigma subunit)/tetratricopeptide (TPR) repeat protein
MKRTIFFIAFCCLTTIFQGQELSRLDSLKLLLAEEKTDTGRVILFYRIAHELQNRDIEASSEYTRKALEEAEKINYLKGKGRAIIQLGNIEQIKGNLEESENYNNEALKICKEINDLAGVAICYNNLGISAHNRNDYQKALSLYKKSLEINRSINRKSGSATSLFSIGTVYDNLGRYDSALVYYIEAQAISESINDAGLMAYANVSLANVYYKMGNTVRSIAYNEAAIRLYEKAGNDYGLLKVNISLGQMLADADSLERAIMTYREALKTGYRIGSINDIAVSYFSLGNIYETLAQNDSSLVNYKKALDKFIEAENYENIAFSLMAVARLDNLKKNHYEASVLLAEALKISENIGSPPALMQGYRDLAMTYSYLKDYKNAFNYYTRYSSIRDSAMTIEKQKQILELQAQYETEKKEKENILLRKDQQILQSTRNSLIIGALLLLLVVFVIFNSLRIKRRDNRLLREQKNEIARQKEIVEEQKASITDSIRYAKRIQAAMLPPAELIDECVPNSFILYLPRDIVSGDFYWMKKIAENRILVCAADCTGHGVPGAFMSMLGMSLLSDIINRNLGQIIGKRFTPADILNSLRERIKEALRQTGKEGESRDGMDMSLCILETDTCQLQYAGANNSIYYVDRGTLTEIKATRNPIGIYLNEISFQNQETKIPPEAVVYMFSDGYSDQIGSEGSKFLSKNFKKLLSEISHLPVDEIRERLHKTHLDWRKEEEQVDDILVIGLRI